MLALHHGPARPLRRESNAAHDLRRVASGSARRREMESPRGVAPRRAGLQSAPTSWISDSMLRARESNPASQGYEPQPASPPPRGAPAPSRTETMALEEPLLDPPGRARGADTGRRTRTAWLGRPADCQSHVRSSGPAGNRTRSLSVRGRGATFRTSPNTRVPPAPGDGIEPSRHGSWKPAADHRPPGIAARTGAAPVSLDRQSSCDTGRITSHALSVVSPPRIERGTGRVGADRRPSSRTGRLGGVRESNPPLTRSQRAGVASCLTPPYSCSSPAFAKRRPRRRRAGEARERG
jgi:hypothetical protein